MELTFGETLFLWRRRHAWTQDQLARRWRTTWRRIRDYEHDRQLHLCPKTLADVTLVGPVLPYERCVLLRRREGLRQCDVARRIGITTFWLRLMELGEAPTKRLEEYWHDQA